MKGQLVDGNGQRYASEKVFFHVHRTTKALAYSVATSIVRSTVTSMLKLKSMKMRKKKARRTRRMSMDTVRVSALLHLPLSVMA